MQGINNYPNKFLKRKVEEIRLHLISHFRRSNFSAREAILAMTRMSSYMQIKLNDRSSQKSNFDRNA